jgi:gamma-glutamyltranspeptidase/glutathione hydrolase
MVYPPEYGPLAAVTPGTPGGLMVMLAEYGRLSLAEVLEPSMQMAEGYPIETVQADNIERRRDVIASGRTLPGCFFRTSTRRTRAARCAGGWRAVPAAGTRSPRCRSSSTPKPTPWPRAGRAKRRSTPPMIASTAAISPRKSFAPAREHGGLFTAEDLADWEVHLEEPVSTRYKGIDVYKLTTWVQGPAMLQALNILEDFDLKSMGYNSASYIHTLYQTMNLAFADRDFYYGDPYMPPAEPVRGLLSKDYAAAAARADQPRAQ